MFKWVSIIQEHISLIAVSRPSWGSVLILIFVAHYLIIFVAHYLISFLAYTLSWLADIKRSLWHIRLTASFLPHHDTPSSCGSFPPVPHNKNFLYLTNVSVLLTNDFPLLPLILLLVGFYIVIIYLHLAIIVDSHHVQSQFC